MPDSNRIGNLAHLDMLKHMIQIRRQQVARLRLQAATGKRLQAESDDPPPAVLGVGDPTRVDMFETLIQLRDALESNDQPTVASLVVDLEAALSAMARVQQLSLFDYI
jgi:hypothetical protein